MHYTYKCFYIGLLCLLLYSCNSERNEEKHQQASTEEQSLRDTLLEKSQQADAYAEWSEFYDINKIELPLDSFAQEGLEKTELYTRPTEAKEYNRPGYENFYVYNRDSSKFIDLFSYSYIITPGKYGKLQARRGEPDQEVAVVDKKNNRRIRILFSGPSSYQAQRAFWYNDQIVGILGIEIENETNAHRPIIWFVNLTNGQTITYGYNGQINDLPSEHLKEIMAKKGVELID